MSIIDNPKLTFGQGDARYPKKSITAINVKDYGAVGNGTTDDAAAIQAAIAAATPLGGTVYIPTGVFLVGTTLTLPGGVQLQGAGVGGDIYSDVDANLPHKGTVLKLKAGTNADLIKTTNFDTLTGQASPSAYATPSRFTIRDLVLDGNKGGNTSGLPLRIFARTYQIDDVTIQNGASGGAYSEYGGGGYEMEARWSNFTITDCNGDGLTWKGPHDSQFVNGLVARNDGFVGIKLVLGSYVGGEMFTNIHVWEGHTYQWVNGSTNVAFVNCVSDGPGGIQLLTQGNQWIGGSIYGTNVPGENAITLGDGTARNISSNNITTRVFNYAKGSGLIRIWPDSVQQQLNWFRIFGSLGGNNRYFTGSGKSKLAGSTTFPSSTLTLSDASTFPTGGGSLYISNGTTILTDVAYTGVSGNTLTGVTGGTGTYAADSSVATIATTAGQNSNEIIDTDATNKGLIQYAQTNTTNFWLSPTSFNVFGQTLRPNSSVVAYQQLRNETGRTDMVWDNSGSFGAYSYQNGATVEGRSNTTNKTWRVNSATGAVQPGTTTGLGGSMFSGSGAPAIAGAIGDYYFRTDTPGTAGQRIYVCTAAGAAGAATWVATAA